MKKILEYINSKAFGRVLDRLLLIMALVLVLVCALKLWQLLG